LPVVLIADDSDSMAGHPAQLATQAIRTLVDGFRSHDLGKEKDRFRLLLVMFGDVPRVQYDFTSMKDVDPASIVVRGQSGGARLRQALEVVADALEANKPQSPHHPAPFAVLLSRGQNCGEDPLPTAQRIKAMMWPCESPPLVKVCGLEDADAVLLEAIATSPWHYSALTDEQDLQKWMGHVSETSPKKRKSHEEIKEL